MIGSRTLGRLTVFTFMLLLASQAQSQDSWKGRLSTIAVKVTSSLKNQPDVKLEGSGLLFRDESGGLAVLTSEHVVFPSNDEAVHRIENTDDLLDVEASFVRSDWARGLALLKIKSTSSINHWLSTYPTREELCGDRWNLEREDVWSAGRPINITSYGFVAGSKRLRMNDGSLTGLKAEGEVLAEQRVLIARDLPTEFGMSGGPVFASPVDGVGFFGLISHVTFERNSRTYIIPTCSAMEWVRGVVASSFFHTVEDLQKQFFSREKTEIVHSVNPPATLERRNGKIFVTIPAGSGTVSTDGLYHNRGFWGLVNHMVQENVRVAEIDNSESLTLQQFATGLLNSYVPSFSDFEGNQEARLSKAPLAPNFSPQRDQQLTFQVTSVSYKYRQKPTGGLAGPVRWETVTERVESRSLRTYQMAAEGWNNQYTASETVAPGQDETWSGNWPGGFNSTDHWRTLLANCEIDGGKLEVVSVEAGTFQTCRKVSGTLTIWYGPVPLLGIVKWERNDGSEKMELKRVRY